MLEKHNTLFLLFQEVEILASEINKGNTDMIAFWTEANEQLNSMISALVENNADFKFYGEDIIRQAFEIVYQTL